MLCEHGFSFERGCVFLHKKHCSGRKIYGIFKRKTERNIVTEYLSSVN